MWRLLYQHLVDETFLTMTKLYETEKDIFAYMQIFDPTKF